MTADQHGDAVELQQREPQPVISIRATIPTAELGEVMGNGVAVLNGVSRGDRVIVTGANQLIDGERVRVIP